MNLKPVNLLIRQIGEEQEIPYGLLLLADETIEIIDTYIKDSEIYILEENSKIIAVYVFQVINKKSVEIKNIAIYQSYQGQEIGKYLLRDATSRTKSSGFETRIIGTANRAIKQLYLFQKEGFEITAIKKNFFVDHYPYPIYENGILCKHMIMLKKQL